ncbi:MAG: FkbM family methyltransferase [Chloroflexi bacterium]|nr:FkbM family methyltransferase [Chloroflexota bacterium]MBP7043325.1 FkbM family methyltransferase [Chloroflexota bacterium]
MIQTILGKIQRRLLARQSDFSQATEQDVYYCYRLLLNRQPDEAGWAYWSDLVNTHHISLQTLADGFLNSFELKTLLEERNRPQLVKLADFSMYVRLNDHFVGATIARELTYEPYVTEEFRHLLRPGMTFLDVGANIGYFTLLAARLVQESGHVYAFEPNPGNCVSLRQSLTENGFNHVTLFQNAAAEKAQTLIFSGGGADSNGRIINESEPMAQEFALPRVEAVVLDDVLADVARIDVVKMDIEGAEPRAWEGMQQLIAKHRPVLVMEFAPDLIRVTSGADPAAFMDAIQTQYDVYVLARNGQKSAAPQDTAAIMAAQAASGIGHVDVVAYAKK